MASTVAPHAVSGFSWSHMLHFVLIVYSPLVVLALIIVISRDDNMSKRKRKYTLGV